MGDKPIDMVLHCPACGQQHIDAPEPECGAFNAGALVAGTYCCRRPLGHDGPHHHAPPEDQEAWTNPPHKSHKCHACGTIWRPADVATNGVQSILTRGKADTWPRQGKS